jgi:hypothetical protein
LAFGGALKPVALGLAITHKSRRVGFPLSRRREGQPDHCQEEQVEIQSKLNPVFDLDRQFAAQKNQGRKQ